MNFKHSSSVNRLCERGGGGDINITPPPVLRMEPVASSILSKVYTVLQPQPHRDTPNQCISCDEVVGFSINLRIPSHLHTFLPHF